jgi:hypothetical protein
MKVRVVTTRTVPAWSIPETLMREDLIGRAEKGRIDRKRFSRPVP